MIEHGEEPSIWYILKVFLIFLVVVVLACMGLKAAIADEYRPNHVLVVTGATLSALALTKSSDACRQDPCNALSHMALGGAISWAVSREYGPAYGVLAALAVGVLKEAGDKHFDVKDAAATAAGGMIYAQWEF